ncbi:TPM domain-containing protein [Pacificimonas sp. ICDLI1SI03]
MALSHEDHVRVSQAIGAAEQMTSGEIFCVFTEGADDHVVVPLGLAALSALLLPPLLLWFGVLDPAWVDLGWSAGGAAGVRETVTLMVAASAILFALTWLIVSLGKIRYRLAPASLREFAVHRAAMEAFLSHGIHLTEGRTGVLIFLSRLDRHAEIIADEGIYTKVDETIWGDTVSAILSHARSGDIAGGFVAAVENAGNVMAEHFPPGAEKPNELPDRLIEV